MRLWAIDANAVNGRFRAVASIQRHEPKNENARVNPPAAGGLAFGPDDWSTDRADLTYETHGLRTLIAESLSAIGARGTELNRLGCVCATPPPSFNPRLASQRGVFLLNCAEGLSFNASLIKMMGSCIHEQSLFADMVGVAGLIRQKTRLQRK